MAGSKVSFFPASYWNTCKGTRLRMVLFFILYTEAKAYIFLQMQSFF